MMMTRWVRGMGFLFACVGIVHGSLEAQQTGTAWDLHANSADAGYSADALARVSEFASTLNTDAIVAVVG